MKLDEEWFLSLTKKQRDILFDLQNNLYEKGFAKDSDFPMKECWEKAAEILKQQNDKH